MCAEVFSLNCVGNDRGGYDFINPKRVRGICSQPLAHASGCDFCHRPQTLPGDAMELVTHTLFVPQGVPPVRTRLQLGIPLREFFELLLQSQTCSIQS